ncbi:MAG: response regulator transcription factor [Chloroflexi bacterium]|nr:MAG: response regulator transcription factor [Chloroflexota bacterium]
MNREVIVEVNYVVTTTRILVVEDDVDIRHVLCVYLKHSGFDVCGAADGLEAISLIPQYRPHLIILDLKMRPVDGWEVLHWLRAQHLTPPLPVLVLTALYHLTEQIHGFEEGAIEYLTKPTPPAIIVERIHTILGLSAEQRALLQRKRIDEQRSVLERVCIQADDFTW